MTLTKKQKKELRDILIALGLFLVLEVLEHAGLSFMENRWISFALYLIPYLIVGLPVLRKAFLGIRNLQMFDESFLMTLATIGAFATGENAEACAVMLFYQVGELFQQYAVGRSRRSITDLMEIAPEFAHIQREDGSLETVDPDEVRIGDVLVVKPGEKVPVDGVILEGDSLIDTAALTGESVPRRGKAGDSIISGCINGEGALKIRAEKEYDDSTVARILEMVEEAADKKSRTETFITRFAHWYTPIVVVGALALALIPSIITKDPATWIYRACTFLVISCPCALVISVPLSFFGGIGAASRIGVLVKGSNFLELMAHLDTVVSDKTGTLTKGEFKVQSTEPAPGVTPQRLLETAARAEGLSTHPIAASIRQAAGVSVGQNPEETENISGKGLLAKVGGHAVLVGNAGLMKDYGIDFVETKDPASTCVYAAEDGHFLGAILIADAVKPEAAAAVAAMKREGVRKVVMLTGDRKPVADAVAEKLGVDEVWSELLPGDKVTKVEKILQASRPAGGSAKVAFIGDGINDAPVLTRADVGIAMGSMGSDAAIEAADIVIMDDDLRRIPAVVRIARKTVGISWQNIIFALAVKVLILILGALGIANMWAAVFADVGVAILCILNAMRILAIKDPVGEIGVPAARRAA